MNPNGSPEDQIHNTDKLFNSVLNHRKCTVNQYTNINLFFSLKEEQGFSLSCGPREIASILAGKVWQ